MARPYSLDLRERVVAQVAGGLSCHEVADLNDLVPSTVVKWSQRVRETGSAAAKPMGGKRPYLLEEQRDWLLARIAGEAGSDAACPSRRAGGRAGRGRLVRYALALLEARGHQLQKKPCTPASRIALTSRAGGSAGKRYQPTPRSEPAGLHRRDLGQDQHDAHCAAGGPRASAWSAKVPHGHWQTLTFLAALRHDRITAPCVIDGPINGESFLAYVEQLLVPTLEPGDIVVMDNLG